MEVADDIPGVEGRPDGRGEDEARILPGRPGGEPFFELAELVGAQGLDGDGRQLQCAPAARRLRLGQDQLPVDPLKLARDRQESPVEIDILPTEAERFALPEADGHGDGVERFEPVAARGGDELPGLLNVQRLDFGPLGLWWRDEAGNVPGDEAPAFSLAERAAQNGMEILYRPRRKARGKLAVQEALNVLRRELRQRHAAESRQQVETEKLRVASIRPRPHRRPGHVLKPVRQELADRLPFPDERKPLLLCG